jgi:hypothetical protein
MNNSKRGQVTIFIIIAIVIVAVIAAVLIIQTTTNVPQGEVQSIKNYLDSCFEDKGRQVVLENAKKGFYYELPPEKIDFLGEKTAYYFKGNEEIVPTITTIEQQLSAAMDEKMLSCLALTEFRQEYDITWSNCVSDAKVRDEGVEFSINCPIIVKKGSATSRFEVFQTSVDCNAKKLINVSNFVVEQYALDYIEDPEYICLTCLGNIGEANNIEITVVPITIEVFQPEHVWFILKDKEKQIDNKNLTLRFVTD